jgi:hypothetical protein
MASWQVTGRLKTGVAALAGAVVVSLVAPASADAAAVNQGASAPNDSPGRAADVQARQKTVPSRPGPADSAAQQSSAPRQSPAASSPSPGFGQSNSPQQTQRKDKPPDRDPHKFSPQHRTPAGNSSPGAGSGSGPATRVGVQRPDQRGPNKATPPHREPAPVPYRDNRHDRPTRSGAPAQAVPGGSGANGSAMQQLQAWTPPNRRKAKKARTHDLVYRYRIVAGRHGDPSVQLLDEDWTIWGIDVWDRDSFGGKFTSDIFVGLWDGATGTVDMLWRLANPGEWDEMMAELAQIAQFAKENPAEFAKQLANWDQWQAEPGRALGNTAFGLIPGAGALAKLRALRKFLNDSHPPRGNGDATPDAQQPGPAPQPQPAPQPDPASRPDPNQQPGPTRQAQPAPQPDPARQPDPAQPAPLPSAPQRVPETPAAAPGRTPEAPNGPAPRHAAGEDRSTPRAQDRPRTADDPGRRATFGRSDSTDYRKTFGNAHPEARDKVVVHHAVERQAPQRYPDAGISQSELHSLENLRGIPKEANARLHLSQIRKEWNRFYRENPTASKQQLLDFATWIDDAFGHLFIPPVR